MNQSCALASVVRVAQLAFSAPEIVLAITQGDHPPQLTANRLLKSVPLPLRWDEQRARPGFGGSPHG
jgi:hypothetical protein